MVNAWIKGMNQNLSVPPLSAGQEFLCEDDTYGSVVMKTAFHHLIRCCHV